MDSNKIEPTKNTKEEIEAAVNAYYAGQNGTKSGNSEPQVAQSKIQAIVRKDEVEPHCSETECECEQKSCNEKTGGKPAKKTRKTAEHKCCCNDDGNHCCTGGSNAYGIGSDSDEIDFDRLERDCMNLDITAAKCKRCSGLNSDGKIDSFLRSINKKILGEIRTGGYSTNIGFRVSQNDWVNVNHIIDWYRSRGFEVITQNVPQDPYVTSGVIEHRFTISWANA